MNYEKLEKYQLTGSIHTIAIKTDGILDVIQPEVANCVRAVSQTQQGQTTSCIINANKLFGEIYTYSEFSTALDTILAGAGITEYRLIRADMSFDSFDPEHFQMFSKLHRYLVSMLAVTYQVNNAYLTQNLFTQKQLNVAIKNRYFEIENYDKEAESSGLNPAYSRLEERSKNCNSNNLILEFTEKWFRRWDKALEHITDVHNRYNHELANLYNEKKACHPVEFRSLTDFIIQYQQCIFCKAQLVDLIMKCENLSYEQALNKAMNHKKRYGIEFFSTADLTRAINEIKRATAYFFGH